MHPRLETERLILRPLALSDLDDYCALWADSEVVRFITGTPIPREECWKRLLRAAGHWQLLGFGFFAVEEKSSGRFIGEAGFHEMRRDMVPSIEGTLEAGWGIDPRVQGRGYAREAMGAALDWAAAAFPDLDYSCIVHPDHARSLHLARVLGFMQDTVSDYAGKPVVVLRKPRAAHAPDPALAP